MEIDNELSEIFEREVKGSNISNRVIEKAEKEFKSLGLVEEEKKILEKKKRNR